MSRSRWSAGRLPWRSRARRSRRALRRNHPARTGRPSRPPTSPPSRPPRRLPRSRRRGGRVGTDADDPHRRLERSPRRRLPRGRRSAARRVGRRARPTAGPAPVADGARDARVHRRRRGRGRRDDHDRRRRPPRRGSSRGCASGASPSSGPPGASACAGRSSLRRRRARRRRAGGPRLVAVRHRRRARPGRRRTPTPLGCRPSSTSSRARPCCAPTPTRRSATLEAIPWVADARVTTQFPHGATIELRERSPVATYQGPDGRFRVIDIDGRVLDVLDAQPVDYLPITSADAVDLEPGQFAAPGLHRRRQPGAGADARAARHGDVGRGHRQRQRPAPGRSPTGGRPASGPDRDLVVKLVRLQTKLDQLADTGFQYVDVSTDDVTTG